MNSLPVYGKGCYIWMVQQIEKGDPKKIADRMEKAGVSFVCIKTHNGVFPYSSGAYEIGPTVEELKKRGIGVGGWGYVYLNSPVNEANIAVSTAKKYDIDFYLIDAEGHAKGKPNQAKQFAAQLRAGLPTLPIGMNSYWKPSYHPELPWNELRAICDFDTPQVYWRGYGPVSKTVTSQREYSLMKKKLPFPMPAGEMYHEFGITTTPAQLYEFLTYCKANYQAALLWSADANETNAELWDAFSKFEWNVASTKLAGQLTSYFDNAKEYALSKVSRLQEDLAKIKAGPLLEDPRGLAVAAILHCIAKDECAKS